MIIGVLGQSGSGKDTLADHLVDRYRFQKVSLADPLKRICKEVYGFSDTQLWGPSEERNKPDLRYPNNKGGFLSPREALQTLGTEWGRGCYEDTWVDYCVSVAQKVMDGEYYTQAKGLIKRGFVRRLFARVPEGVVIPDVRFKNEVRKIHRANGVIIRLRREGKDGNLKAGIKNHASEMEQQSIMDDEVDFVIDVPEGIPAFKSAINSVFLGIQATGRFKMSA